MAAAYMAVGELDAALGRDHVASFAHGPVGDGYESDMFGSVAGADLLPVRRANGLAGCGADSGGRVGVR